MEERIEYSIDLAIDSLEQCIKNNDFDIITLDRIQYAIEILKEASDKINELYRKLLKV